MYSALHCISNIVKNTLIESQICNTQNHKKYPWKVITLLKS